MSFFSDINFYFSTIITASAYLLGSISFGIVIAKFMNLADLRSIGSGNIGATNVLRTGSKVAALLTIILDGGKGYMAILITLTLFEHKYLPFAGIAVFLGHIYPIYFKFKGGKGVATFLGIILAINPIVWIITCITWLSLAIVTKKSSVAALGCSILTPVFLFMSEPSETVICMGVLTILICYLHKDNIKRLILRTEPSITLNKSSRK